MTDKTNHPRRTKPDLPGTPMPEQILAARRAAGVSNFKAAELIMHTVAQFDAFETGERRMHPIIWWAFQQRVKGIE